MTDQSWGGYNNSLSNGVCVWYASINSWCLWVPCLPLPPPPPIISLLFKNGIHSYSGRDKGFIIMVKYSTCKMHHYNLFSVEKAVPKFIKTCIFYIHTYTYIYIMLVWCAFFIFSPTPLISAIGLDQNKMMEYLTHNLYIYNGCILGSLPFN